MTDKPNNSQRIAKLIARSGYCSRREAERWIEDGRVKVNGITILSPALNVSEMDIIEIDGNQIFDKEPTKLWIFHKPTGLVTTHKDPENRPTVFDSLPKELGRVISVGRLDLNSEGLLLLTNDGELARQLELPKTGFLRTYRARAFGKVTQKQLDDLQNGIVVDGVKYGAITATLERSEKSNVWIMVSIAEGKNREVRKVLAALDLKVNRLIRISYGPFELGNIPKGAIIETSVAKAKKAIKHQQS